MIFFVSDEKTSINGKNKMSITRASKRLFTAASCLGIVLVQLDVSIVNVGLHSLKEAYDAAVSDLEWVINAYALVFAALMLSSGSIVDRFGSKKTFISGVLLFIAASVCCALAPTIYWLDFTRGIQGIGAALLLPSSLTLLRQYFSDPRERASAIAMWAAAGSLALVAGPVAGGLLIKFFGWKSLFLINFPLGMLSVIVIQRLGPASPQSSIKMNLSSQGFIILGLAMLTFTLTEAGNYGWANPVILTTLVLGVALMAVFHRVDNRSTNPVIARGVRDNPLIVSAVVVGFLCNLVFYGAVFIFSIFFQNRLHLSALETGIAFMPMMALTALVNFCSKWFSAWFSVRTLSILGSLISMLGFAIIFFITPGWTADQLFIPMILLGSGTSFAMPVMTNVVLSQATQSTAGSASAYFNCARQMGGVTGVAVFGLILSTGGDDMTQGLRLVAYAAAAVTLCWVIVSLKKLPFLKLQALSSHE
ncbi:MFS transporter [Klebsiella variicola subsp. tropica]|uniref:MFS transporter n=1 Tax=Klebsiella variicola TaxID=244366 RepID=UPI0022853626|nr:MFS transporter [Klebsiella variicola]WAL53423.1 MFS transporter [Klebsiella variicola subsp. tropica]